jgi:hypothetical protein
MHPAFSEMDTLSPRVANKVMRAKMKHLLTRMAGLYAAAGVLGFLLYRSGYRQTRAIREWTDVRGRHATAALSALREDLRRLQRDVRQIRWQAKEHTRPVEADPTNQSRGHVPRGRFRPNENRHLTDEMPAGVKRVA